MSFYWNNRAFYNSYVNRYGYRYPRSYCPDPFYVQRCEAPTTLKCYQPAPVCVEKYEAPTLKCYQPAPVCIEKCVPETVVVPTCIRRSNSFVQLTETKCEVRDHDQYDCKYDYKFTEAGDNKLITKSHKNQISNMTKSMTNMSNCFDETPTTTVEVVSLF